MNWVACAESTEADLERCEDRLKQWLEERESVRQEAAELVERMGAEAAFWHVRSARRDRLKTDAERARLSKIMHRIYDTEDIYCPTDTAQHYLDAARECRR